MKTLMRISALAAAVAAMAPALADSAATPLAAVTAHPAPAEAMLRDELRGVLARMMDSGAFAGVSPEEIALSLSLPAERHLDLGLLVDSRGGDARGLSVLGTLPGAGAQALGVRGGDRLLAVNGKSLVGLPAAADGSAGALEVLKGEVDALREGGVLKLELERDGARRTLEGPVQAQFIPAVRLELGEGALLASTAPMAVSQVAASVAAQSGDSCGRISVFHVAPRSQKLYPAKILAIDGKIPGPATQDTYRLAPGVHEVKVAEQIDEQDLPLVYTRARRHRDKTFEVVVQPGTTHLVASQFHQDKQHEVAKGGYWDPVVWKEVQEPCR